MGKKVFISYSHHDKDIAIRIQEALIALGHHPFRDEHDINAYDRLSKKILESIASIDFFLLLWSKASSHSRWVKSEALIARSHKKRMVCICLDDTPYPEILPDQVFLHLPPEPYDLLEFIRGIFKKSYTRKVWPLA